MAANYYDILEISPRARDSVIEASFRALMREFHPDRTRDDTAAKAVTEAHATLSNPVKRAEYDAERQPGGGTIIGNYRVLEFIAEGGIGRTYKGEHVDGRGRLVCIKHCSKVTSQRIKILHEEADAMWDLRHYGVPVMRDVITLADGSVALVMSYISGLTLAQIVEKVGLLEAEHVCWIAERALNTLLYVHRRGIIHGDLKPQNIMVEHESHAVTLVDFGLAASKPQADDKNKGYTEIFSPPEQIQQKPLLPESDFYSLGMSMIYALTGDLRATKAKQVPDATPEPVCAFIRKLTKRSIGDRPTDAEQLFLEIQKVRTVAFGRSRTGMSRIPGL